ncbi:MAG: hypothetical protein LBS00_11985 [Synergistaceae bacterium]|jgi:hypothetical protein|nr:hypothetical protein [Synergistaceae bacterium]
MTDNRANREYKDSFFSKLCEDKKRLIEIYNAVSGRNYSLDVEVEVVTLDDVLFLARRNDVAFIVEGRIVVLMEHQSTLCENMPIRILIYIALVFEKLFNADPRVKRAIYGTKLVNIPKPEFFVLYNGGDKFPEKKELRLSDAFLTVDTSDVSEWLRGFLELIVPIYNVSEGHNEDILRKSETLFGYAAFVGQVRRYLEKGYRLEEAIEQAVKDCVEKDILAEFLRVNASEVINMLTAEFKMEEAVKIWKEEGMEEGMEKGKEEMAKNLLVRGVSPDLIAEGSGLPMERIRALMN